MTDDGTLSAVEYHEETKHTPRSVRSTPGLNFENKPTPYKRYTDLPTVDLPAPGELPPIETPALEAVTVEERVPPGRDPFWSQQEDIGRETIGALCFYAAGITKEIELRNRTAEFRAAACTGALYHVNLYLVCDDLADLDAGVYHYDPRTHSLDILRKGDYRGVLADASGGERNRRAEEPDDGGEGSPVGTAPVTVVTTSEWWRNAWKYRDRTFRHAFWDSGTVAANLLATAHARGLPASVCLGFADSPVVELLGLDPTDEAPLELVPVGGGDSAPRPESVDPLAPETAPLSPNPREFPAIYRAWRGGTLPTGERAVDWRETARSTAPVGVRKAGDGPRVDLEPVDRETASKRPLDGTIRRRGSCRAYDREEVSSRKLSTVLDRAVRGTPLDVRGVSAGSGDGATGRSLSFCDCYLLVNGVEGLDPGSYQFHPDEGALELLQRGEFREEAGHLALNQRLGADAAVCTYFLSDVEAVTDALGDRGYRVAQFESALTAGRLYLATYAHRRLGGTGLTFFDDVVTDFFAPRATGQTPMFLYTMGRPAR
jgi:SagB-type dehydrogenase family enzyme